MKKLHRENIVACMIFSVILHGVALYLVKTSEESEVRRPFTDSTHFAVVRHFEAVWYDDANDEIAPFEALPRERKTTPSFPALKRPNIVESKRTKEKNGSKATVEKEKSESKAIVEKEKSESKASVAIDAIGARTIADFDGGGEISEGEGNSENSEVTARTEASTGSGDKAASSSPAPSLVDVDAIWEAYAKEIKRILLTSKRYPAAAKAMRLEGLVILYVTINRNGDVLTIDVAESSGYAVLDDAARQSVRKKSPLPPFPAEIRVSERILKIPFRYTLKNS